MFKLVHYSIRLRGVLPNLTVAGSLLASGAVRSEPGDLHECRDAAQPNAAVVACTRLIETNRSSSPELVAAYLRRAAALRNNMQLDAALRDANAALRLDPNSMDALTLRGTIYTIQQQPGAAISDLDRVLTKDPNRIEALAARGAAYGEKGDYKAALRDFDLVLQLDPRASRIYHERGMTYRLLDQHGRAFRDFEEAHKLAPDNPFVLMDLASCYLLGLGVARNSDQAAVLLSKAAQLGFSPAKELLAHIKPAK